MNVFRKASTKEQLGQVLLQRRVVTSEQLQQALDMQKENGGLLGEILIKLGATTEEDIVQALAIQHDFPYLPLANYNIDEESLKLIPENIVRKYGLLPIDKMGDVLTVVMANPLNEQVLAEIETLTKCKIEIFVATYTEIKEAIERCYAQKETS